MFYEKLAEMADTMSMFGFDDIEEMYVEVVRGPNDYRTVDDIANTAKSIILWQSIFSPFNPEESFLDGRPLLAAIDKSAQSMFGVAVFAYVRPNAMIYYRLLSMDHNIAARYFEHCCLHLYANPDEFAEACASGMVEVAD